MREIEHGVSRQEALSLPNNRCVVNDLSNTLERVHVIGLNVVRLFFSSSKRAQRMALEDSRYGIGRENAESVIQRTSWTGGTTSHEVSCCNVPALHQIGAKRNDEFTRRGLAWQRTEHEIVFIP